MRLIDADYFKEQIAAATLKQNIDPAKGLALIELVDAQPTACDLENVIEQLSGLKKYQLGMADAMSEVMNKGRLGNYVCLEDAETIIKSAINSKGGGKENG